MYKFGRQLVEINFIIQKRNMDFPYDYVSLKINEKLLNGQEDPENPVYLSEKKGLLRFSFSQS
jgi:hypothetical protein